MREASLNGKKNGPFASNQNDEVDKLLLHRNNALLFARNALSFCFVLSYDISQFSSAYLGPPGAKSSELLRVVIVN